MALTRDFKETIRARVTNDPAFREALLKEGVECLLSGDVDLSIQTFRFSMDLPYRSVKRLPGVACVRRYASYVFG